ncbi:flavin reductase family protein [Ensifer sp. YR511]|uniref:flavin reductase family protein n=1 Tax=Ensifer sp. YR511 TaxID=1855294 RepID=UPI0008801B20|nr:flavin reductase family protein [Ensifer sp. YR511]SDN80106.1 NADH-FMN oxidoreductase RutF, flavin reductase (DIM6/NTAB) family [Ensifer sp. YR511]
MFFDPILKDHGLPYNPFKSCVVPRPIGWISTIMDDGRINLAPYSQFNIVGFDPGYVMFSANRHPPDWRRKDSSDYAERRGEFVYNMATWELRQYVTRSSQIYDRNISEVDAVGLTTAPSRKIKTPRIAESPVAFECEFYSTMCLPGDSIGTSHYIVVGKVVGIHIDDSVIGKDGKLDIPKIKPLARLGYADYTCVEHVFPIELEDDWANQEDAASHNRYGLVGGG